MGFYNYLVPAPSVYIFITAAIVIASAAACIARGSESRSQGVVQVLEIYI